MSRNPGTKKYTGGEKQTVVRAACNKLFSNFKKVCYTVYMPLSRIVSSHDIPQFIFCGNTILTGAKENALLPDAEVSARCIEFQVAEDWFTDTDHRYTALMLENGTPPIPPDTRWIPLRQFFAEQPEALASLAARAHGLLAWRHTYRYCPSCGAPLRDDADETARVCIKCERTQFPVLEPAVIVIVRKAGRILLARHRQRNTNIYTCLAGYVEHGETLEQCVYREVKEETGIEVTNITYRMSQSWPFPDQLMVGFSAEWQRGELCVQPNEIQEAAWFDPDRLPDIPAPGSLAYRLITGR